MPLLQDEEVEALKARVRELHEQLKAANVRAVMAQADDSVRDELAAAKLRVKELDVRLRESEEAREFLSDLYSVARPVSVINELRAQLDAASADRARLRGVLQSLLPTERKINEVGVDWNLATGRYYLSVAGWAVAMEGDVSRDEKTGRTWDGATIKAVVEHFNAPIRAALASTDAAQWLRARERRVAERVQQACVAAAVSTGPCKEHRHQCELDQTVDTIVDVLKTVDLDALLGEP